ncbi:hypothetical protein [Ensifer canadensis]
MFLHRNVANLIDPTDPCLSIVEYAFNCLALNHHHMRLLRLRRHSRSCQR